MAEKFIFVIDTESYAGNFERQMTGFCTGKYGDCGVGDKESNIFHKEMKDDDIYTDPDGLPLFEGIAQRPDKNGCSRPTAIWPTPGWFNNGVGGHFKEGQEEKAIAHRDKTYETDAAYKDRTKTEFVKYDAFMSVAIFFDEYPSDDEIDLMIERAMRFAAERPDAFDYEIKTPIVITKFRLLTEEHVQKEIMSRSVN